MAKQVMVFYRFLAAVPSERLERLRDPLFLGAALKAQVGTWETVIW